MFKPAYFTHDMMNPEEIDRVLANFPNGGTKGQRKEAQKLKNRWESFVKKYDILTARFVNEMLDLFPGLVELDESIPALIFSKRISLSTLTNTASLASNTKVLVKLESLSVIHKGVATFIGTDGKGMPVSWEKTKSGVEIAEGGWERIVKHNPTAITVLKSTKGISLQNMKW